MEGLIHALELDGSGGAVPLDDADLNHPRAGRLRWIHLDYSAPETVAWLQERSGLDPLVVQALLDDDTRPRAHDYPGGLLLTLRGVNLNPGQDPEDMVSIRLWVEPGLIVSTRRRPLLSVREIGESLKSGQGPGNEGSVIVELSRRLVARMSQVIDELEDTASELEAEMLEQSARASREALQRLRRQIIALRRYLHPQREALESLRAMELPFLGDQHRLRLRESENRLTRYLEDLAEARERAVVLHEELVNRQTELMNQRMYVLSLVAAVFLPLGFLTGLMGVNIGGMPGVDNPYAFWIFTASLIVSALLTWIYFRTRHWL